MKAELQPLRVCSIKDCSTEIPVRELVCTFHRRLADPDAAAVMYEALHALKWANWGAERREAGKRYTRAKKRYLESIPAVKQARS